MYLQLILDKIRRDKGFDLSGYKESTLRRRIERRMRFDGVTSWSEYIRLIDKDAGFYWRLISDLFIGVTDFFRDKEIWQVMKEEILPEIIKNKPKDCSKPILRVWSAGCSTGEETYSLAILLHQVLGAAISDFIIYVYGTDIMHDKLDGARRGIYSREKLKNIDENIKFKYFSLQVSGYVVSDEIRRLTYFYEYDLVRDKEFRGFDIIACRNVLIYFKKDLQENALFNFHKALNPGAILWLGASESLLGRSEKLFTPLHKSEKIFRKVR